MITAFISHSSKQKDFAKKIVQIVGRDFCIIDCFDFSPAYETLNEIYKAIDDSSLFVLLISKDSLDSDWVKREIAFAKDSLDKQRLDRFLPYIIDETVSFDDIPEWILKEKAYNLKLFKSPIMLARDIQQKQRDLLWSKNSKIKLRDNVFVGRNDKIEEFQNKFYSSTNRCKKVLITSGRDGVGKTKFVNQCIITELGYDPSFVPYTIWLDSKSSIENFIVQLNDITLTYTINEINNILLENTVEKVNLAVELLNEIYELKGVIYVDDIKCCVRPDRQLSQWFIDVITNENLTDKLGLFLFSGITPSSFIEQKYKEIIHIQLLPLNTQDRKKLFFKYVQIYGLNVTDSDADFFVKKLLGSPEQMRLAVEAIKDKGVRLVKHDIDEIIAIGDKNVTTILNNFKENNLAKNLLILLSKFEFISFNLLQNAYEDEFDEIEKIIIQFIVYSIVEVFGPSGMYIRLDSSISDYIQRNRMKMDKEMERLLEEALSQIIIDSNNLGQDLSTYLYDIKKQLLRGRDCHSNFLIPSIVVKTIIDLYNKNDWDNVVILCDKVLNDCKNYYDEINEEITYWLCLALCRKTDRRFYDVVSCIYGIDNTFLRGFYFRNEHNFKAAEKCYKQVLEENPQMNKAKRELVTVLLSQKKYSEALELAEQNYINFPTNTYHITAFFRCLIRKTQPLKEDITMLNHLMNDIKNCFSPKKESLLLSMQIEYAVYIKKENATSILEMIQQGMHLYPDSNDIRRVANEYKYKQKIDLKLEQFAEDDTM